ncbi:transglycosylase [Rubrivirga marina]|uniref:Transglycosylase n=1 Tax=Rubrivirga marina TaxID=1196024 RepID=A0A271J7P1_9BACT|nr:transglycosylase [Rubrivirga marina]
MNFILFLVIGGLIGWAASKVMGTDAQQGILLNVVVGIIGAFLAGLVISPLVGVPDLTDSLSLGAVAVSFVGACLLLFVVSLFRGRRRAV